LTFVETKVAPRRQAARISSVAVGARPDLA
jgi:hypothetical protein